MVYKALGFVIWQGAKLYLRRQMRGSSRKIAIGAAGAVAAAVIAGALVAQRQGAE